MTDRILAGRKAFSGKVRNTGLRLRHLAIVMSLSIFPMSLVSARPSKSTPSHPFPGDPTVDIWLLAGQSNMFGSAPIPDKLTPPDPRIQLFNMNDRWIVAQEPLHRIFEANAPIIMWFRHNDGMTTAQIEAARTKARTTPGGSGVGPGLFFARRVVQNLNSPLGLIPNSPGGSSMEHWSPALKDAHGNSLYGAMMDRVAMTGGHPRGLLWYQGEGEAMDTSRVPIYKDALINLFKSVRRDTESPDLPIIFVQICRYTNGAGTIADSNWEKIREAQRQVAQILPNTYMISTIDLPMTDFLHLNYAAQERLGHRLGEVALSKVYNLPGHGTPIDLESITIKSLDNDGRQTSKPAQSEIHVKFKGVTGRLVASGRPTGFELRYPDQEKNDAAGSGPQPYRIDFDPEDPASVILHLKPALPQPAQLYYGAGANPYVNITDEKDIPIPALGPVDLIVKP